MKKLRDKTIVIYDGTCKLCSKSVHFLEMSDHPLKFNIIPSSAPVSDELLESYHISKNMVENSVIVIENGQAYTKSNAVIKALQRKGGVWQIFGFFMLLPVSFRDTLYNLIARKRRKLHADPTNQ